MDVRPDEDIPVSEKEIDEMVEQLEGFCGIAQQEKELSINHIVLEHSNATAEEIEDGMAGDFQISLELDMVVLADILGMYERRIKSINDRYDKLIATHAFIQLFNAVGDEEVQHMAEEMVRAKKASQQTQTDSEGMFR